jgi:XrtN system VIT domain protein
MSNENKHPWKDGIWITGISLIIISTIVFLFPDFITIKDGLFGIFVGNYGIAIIYFIVLLMNGIWSFWKKNYQSIPEYIALFLVLCLISAFSLNREIDIFHESALWLQVYIVGMCLCFIGISFRKFLPAACSYGLFFFLGASFLLCTYFSIYLAPFYHIGLFAFFILGLSLHLFIPLLFAIFIIWLTVHASRANSRLIYFFLAGILLPLLFSVYFSIRWNQVNKEIAYTYNSVITDYENTLPNWVKVSQSIGHDWITEKVIKSDLVYVTPNGSGSFFRTPNLRSFGEVKQHDPLIMVASVLTEAPDIAVDDKVKILESMYNSRHLAQERLWGGKYLSSSNIITDVFLYPELRLSYTEKIIDVKNNQKEDRWEGRQQEAIYTFNLPEGTVVTSLSLWISGKEEKGILTTKQKANTAYKTIVGVESRDPSLIHWQEGNTVSVRVFPCTPKEARKFRIGFTSPLTISENKVIYKNVNFEGPSADDAPETVIVRLGSSNAEIELPGGFRKTSEQMYKRDGSYDEEWQISMKPNPIPDNSFSFDGYTYQIQDYKKNNIGFSPDAVYLDLNSAWSKEDFYGTLDLLKAKEVFVFQNSQVRVTGENKEGLFDYFSTLNFSVFPFHKIEVAGPLVISKSTDRSPNLHDLKGSEFATSLSKKIQDKKIRLFNLGGSLSPYLKTLKEFRAFD